jgi:hypothetical protein
MLYAIKIRKAELGLIKLLNNGGPVKIEKKRTYFVVDISDNGASVSTDILTERELLQTYVLGSCPFILSLKK